MLFVIDDGSRTPQQVLLTPPNSAKVSDFRWHPVKIEKEGRVVSFVGLNSSSHVYCINMINVAITPQFVVMDH